VESKPAEVVFEEVVEAKLGSISGTGFGCRNHTDLSTVRAGVDTDTDTDTDACEGWLCL